LNQSFGRGVQRGQTIAHVRKYSIGCGGILEGRCMVCGAL
jgi:hypothetical protein